jgi:hypothetical protein
MPEWMDDNNDDDNQLNNATFEQDGTFTRLTSVRQDSINESQKTQSSEESLSQSNTVIIDFNFLFYYLFLFQGSNTTRRRNKT